MTSAGGALCAAGGRWRPQRLFSRCPLSRSAQGRGPLRFQRPKKGVSSATAAPGGRRARLRLERAPRAGLTLRPQNTSSGARLGNPHLGPFGLLVKKICTHLYILDFAHLPPLRGTKTKILSPTGDGGGGWRFSLSTLCTRSPRKNAHCRVWLLLLSA